MDFKCIKREHGRITDKQFSTEWILHFTAKRRVLCSMPLRDLPVKIRRMDKLNMNESVIFHGWKFSVCITSTSDHYILSPLLFKIQIQLINKNLLYIYKTCLLHEDFQNNLKK